MIHMQPGGFLIYTFTMGATAYYTQAKSDQATEYSVLTIARCDVERAYSEAGQSLQ